MNWNNLSNLKTVGINLEFKELLKITSKGTDKIDLTSLRILTIILDSPLFRNKLISFSISLAQVGYKKNLFQYGIPTKL